MFHLQLLSPPNLTRVVFAPGSETRSPEVLLPERSATPSEGGAIQQILLHGRRGGQRSGGDHGGHYPER